MIIFVLSIHLLLMNLASAGPLFSVWLGRRGVDNDSVWDDLGRRLAWLSFWAFVLGIFAGGGQLFLAPSAGLWDALARFPIRALWIAGAELAFSLVCLLLYAGSWSTLGKHRLGHASLALLSSSNLLYHFPPLMSVLGKLVNDPTWAKSQTLDRSALLPLMMRGEIVALSTHFVLASLAVAAIVVLWLASQSDKDQRWQHSVLPLARRAAGVALIVSVMQLPVGIWLFISVPQTARAAMMGNSVVASLAFIGALLLTFLLLQRLLTIAIGTIRPSELRQVCWLLVTLVLLMTTTLHKIRQVREQPGQANQDQPNEASQTTPAKRRFPNSINV